MHLQHPGDGVRGTLGAQLECMAAEMTKGCVQGANRPNRAKP